MLHAVSTDADTHSAHDTVAASYLAASLGYHEWDSIIKMPYVGCHDWDAICGAQVAAGLGHTVCCMADGSAYSWGWGSDGQLGLGSQQGSLRPQLVDADVLEHLDVAKVVTSGRMYSSLDRV